MIAARLLQSPSLSTLLSLPSLDPSREVRHILNERKPAMKKLARLLPLFALAAAGFFQEETIVVPFVAPANP